VANLLTARSAARAEATATERFPEGNFARLLREQFIETLVLFSVGGAAGLALAYAALRWFVITRTDMVPAESIGIDAVVIATVAGLVLICALLAGLMPVLASRSENLVAALGTARRLLHLWPFAYLCAQSACGRRSCVSRRFCSPAPAYC
jgi:hypothetical protein